MTDRPTRTVATAFNINTDKLLEAFGLKDKRGISGVVLEIRTENIVTLYVEREMSVEEVDAMIDSLTDNPPTLKAEIK